MFAPLKKLLTASLPIFFLVNANKFA